MTDQQKLAFLLKELKLIAKKTHCYDGKYGDDLYYYTEDHNNTFDDGSKYGLVSFARSILESIGETYT